MNNIDLYHIVIYALKIQLFIKFTQWSSSVNSSSYVVYIWFLVSN